MAFNKMPIISKPNVDAYGNLQLVQVTNEPHEIFKNKIVLDGIPDKFSRVTISDDDETIYVEKFDTDTLTGNQFKVNYSDGVINFPVTLEGKSILVSYYSKGIELVSAERIYTKIGDNGDVVETLDDKVAEMIIMKQNYDNATHVDLVRKVILSYTATQDATSFILDAENYNPLIDIVWLYYKNTILLQNKQYVITGTTVTLNDWTLPSGDTIDIVVERAVKDLPPAGGNGADLMLGSVGENKLSADVQLKLNKTLVIQDYTFTATQDNTTTFIIESDIFNPVTDTLDIYRENLRLSKDINYSLLGQTVTLATALNIGDFVEYRITKNTSNSVPLMPDGSIIQNGTITEVKLTETVREKINKSTTIEQEIQEARDGKANLKAKIDEIDADSSKLGYENTSLDTWKKRFESEYINVKDLGVKGDFNITAQTGTDDTVNIQNALNNKGRIYFPEGVYKTTDYLKVYKDTTIELHPNAIIYRGGGSSHYKVFANGEIGVSTPTAYNGQGNIHFIGGTIDLNYDHTQLGSEYNSTVMDIGHGENISFKNMTFKNGQNGHYFQVTGSKDVLFDNCIFEEQNLTHSSSLSFECIQIETISSAGFPSFGAYDYTPSKNITIQNCKFSNVIRAIGSHADTLITDGDYSTQVFCENIKIINNTFDTSIDTMITLRGYKNVTFENNSVLNAGLIGVHLCRVHNSKIENNTILNSAKPSLQVELSDNNKIDSNYHGNPSQYTITNPSTKYAGIRVYGSSYNTFSNETVTAETAYYSYAYYASTTTVGEITIQSIGNKIGTYNFTSGTSGSISTDGSILHYTQNYNSLSWCSVGDSITNGGSVDGVSVGNYQTYSLPYIDKVITHYKRGYGGYCVSCIDKVAHPTYYSINEKNNEIEVADIYTVFMGTNDFSRQLPIGSRFGSSTGDYDFFGGLKQLYVNLTAKNMNAIIVFITPLKRFYSEYVDGSKDWNDDTVTNTLDKYVDAIKEFAEYYSCPVLDLFAESGVSNRTHQTFLVDCLHPNLECNKRIGKKIGNEINRHI